VKQVAGWRERPEGMTMEAGLGTIEIVCDAPPYAVVRACQGAGFCSPLDVRWCNIRPLLKGQGQGAGTFGMRFWRWLLGKRGPNARRCTCGRPLPELRLYTFTFNGQKVGEYLLGQCCRCRTMFWAAAAALPAWLAENMTDH
jgi:hypothetical protein